MSDFEEQQPEIGEQNKKAETIDYRATNLTREMLQPGVKLKVETDKNIDAVNDFPAILSQTLNPETVTNTTFITSVSNSESLKESDARYEKRKVTKFSEIMKATAVDNYEDYRGALLYPEFEVLDNADVRASIAFNKDNEQYWEQTVALKFTAKTSNGDEISRNILVRKGKGRTQTVYVVALPTEVDEEIRQKHENRKLNSGLRAVGSQIKGMQNPVDNKNLPGFGNRQ